MGRSGWRLIDLEPAISAAATEIAEATRISFPPRFALRGPRTVVCQRDVPCCVSCCLATAMEVLRPGYAQLAPLFHYYVTRFRRYNTAPNDMTDLDFDEAFSILGSDGICLYQYHRFNYDSTGAAKAPCADAIKDAAGRLLQFDVVLRIPAFERLSDQGRISEWKRALISGHPIVLGMIMPERYIALRDQLVSTGKAPFQKLTAVGQATQYGHAVAVLGYNELERAFIAQDSQGEEFGSGGQWWMPYEMVESGLVKVAYQLNH